MDLTQPFVARGEEGEVRVRFLPNGNPERWGYDILGLEGDVSRAAAFPVFEATVIYTREGYAAIFGWIQIVRYSSRNGAPPSDLVDVAPQLRGLGVPFLAYGVRATCFDAPLDTPEGMSRWEALTFLTQSPDGLMTRTVEPILGFRWGYEMDGDEPLLAPPVLAQPDEWRSVRAKLEVEFPTWAFEANLPTPRPSA